MTIRITDQNLGKEGRNLRVYVNNELVVNTARFNENNSYDLTKCFIDYVNSYSRGKKIEIFSGKNKKVLNLDIDLGTMSPDEVYLRIYKYLHELVDWVNSCKYYQVYIFEV